MRYNLEYLSESTDEDSVMTTVGHGGPLEAVVALALSAERQGDGCQIRDLDDGRRIVWLQHFNV